MIMQQETEKKLCGKTHFLHGIVNSSQCILAKAAVSRGSDGLRKGRLKCVSVLCNVMPTLRYD
jgi:hypothetical protein